MMFKGKKRIRYKLIHPKGKKDFCGHILGLTQTTIREI